MDSSCPSAGEYVAPNELGFMSGIYGMEFTGVLKGSNLHFEYATQKIISRLPGFWRHPANPGQATRNLASAAADVATLTAGKDLYVVGLSSVVTTALVADTAVPVMSIEKRTAAGASAVEIATITYTDLDPVGEVDSVFVGAGDVGGGADSASLLASPYLIPAGFQLVLKHKTQATSASSAAGAAICHIWVASSDYGEPMPDGFNLSGLSLARFTAYGW